MPKRPFVRALIYSAGAALLILLAILAYRHFSHRADERREARNDFNPAAY